MEQDLVEARELLEKVATLMEDAGWPGYAMEIADMANAVAGLPYRGWRPQATSPLVATPSPSSSAAAEGG
jgi:hypothetical protein